MTSTDERLFYLRVFLEDCAEGKMDLEFVSEEEWDDVTDPLGIHVPLGFTFPQLGPNLEDLTTESFVWEVCLERIVAVTADLDEHDFNEYLVWMKLHCDLHIIHSDKPLSVVERLIEDHIDAQPGAARVMEIVHQVQLRALDA